jgi:hypothetical protein
VPVTRIFAERDAGQDTKADGLLEGVAVPRPIQPKLTHVCLAAGSASAYIGHSFSSTFAELVPRAGSKYAHHS